MLLLESAMIGVFLALDALVFFIFFEFVLVPMYFLIAGWGHDNRRYAAMKFYLFTAAGSAFLFAGIVSVAFMHQHATHVLTFDVRTLTDWAAAHVHGGTAKVLFLAFAVGFAVKVPLFPFHTWLPDAHTDAPTAGSVVLAGVMLKIGAYGFLRFAIPFFPQAAVDLAPLLIVLAVIGITYGAIVAAMQPNLKRIVAYSSVAHLGFVVLGVFALTNQGISGGLFTMLSHGLTTGALFLLVGMLYDRRHTYELSNFRGIWKVAPVFGGLFVAATFASIGLPGFSGFVGEFLSLLGAFLTSRWYVVVAATGVILAAVYLLWAVQRAFTGEPDDENRATPDIGFREIVTVVPLLGLSLFLGFYPKPVLDRLQPSVQALIQHVEQNSNYKAPTAPTPPVAGAGRGGGQVIGADDRHRARAGRLVRDRARDRAVRRRDPHRDPARRSCATTRACPRRRCSSRSPVSPPRPCSPACSGASCTATGRTRRSSAHGGKLTGSSRSTASRCSCRSVDPRRDACSRCCCRPATCAASTSRVPSTSR